MGGEGMEEGEGREKEMSEGWGSEGDGEEGEEEGERRNGVQKGEGMEWKDERGQ